MYEKNWKRKFTRLIKGTRKCCVIEIVHCAYCTSFQELQCDRTHFFKVLKNLNDGIFNVVLLKLTTINKDKTVNNIVSFDIQTSKCIHSNACPFAVKNRQRS